MEKLKIKHVPNFEDDEPSFMMIGAQEAYGWAG